MTTGWPAMASAYSTPNRAESAVQQRVGQHVMNPPGERARIVIREKRRDGGDEPVASDGHQLAERSRSFRTTTPPFITNFTRCISVTSASGSPDTAMRSAYLPFSMLPTCSAQP